MKIKAILMAMLLVFSMNTLASENQNSFAKTEFSAEKKQRINIELEAFGERYVKALDNLQREYIIFRNEQKKLGKTLPNEDSIKFHLNGLIRVKKNLESLPLNTNEVKLIRKSSLEGLNTQIQFKQREEQIGFGKNRNDPQLLALLQKMTEQEKASVKLINDLKLKIK